MKEENKIETYKHGERTLQGRIMEKDPVWTTIMVYKDGKPDKPLTVKTFTLKKVTKFHQRNAN